MSTDLTDTPAAAEVEFEASERYRYYVLVMLILVGICSWVDRTIFSILLEPIKLEFTFSDTQLGLLGGVAFGLFYAAVGLPIAWLADRYNRKNIIAIAIAIWSSMTALSGLAVNFTTLFLARMGVGIGEAGGSPPSQSLVVDYFPPKRRAWAMGILFMYIPLGFFVGFLLGGWINEFFGWRAAFMVVGLPGLVLALLVFFTVREPPRGFSEPVRRKPAPQPSLPETIRYFLSRPALRHLPLAGAMHGIGAWGAGVWMPAYFMRVHGMGSGEIGWWLAVAFGVFGTLGSMLGGRLADKLVNDSGDPRWYAWFSAIAILSCLPFYFAVYLLSDPTLALLVFMIPVFLGHMFLGPVTGMIQSLAGVKRRAMAAAFYLFLANMISMGGGPLVIGIISDLFTERFGTDALRYSLLTLVVVTGIWAAVHFTLAARTLREDLAMAEADD
jgi:predicted MFS family arabinose efflux permease